MMMMAACNIKPISKNKKRDINLASVSLFFALHFELDKNEMFALLVYASVCACVPVVCAIC